MKVKELVEKAKRSKGGSLSESDSKALLRTYGVPVVYERVAEDENTAVKAAEEIGFPVVMKALGASLTHKTERRLVHLNVTNRNFARTAAREIIKEAGEELEGILIQPQIMGKREFVAGFFRDNQFGPMVMFGVGGIFAEALSDVSFGVAPLSEGDASAMINEIKAQAILGPFRGEKEVNRPELIQSLMGVSRIAHEIQDIAEIDINPLIATHDGSLLAVDALVVTGDAFIEKKYLPPVSPMAIRALFYPRSVAFVGASAQLGKWGHALLTNTIAGNYKGEIYLVNPAGEPIAGRKVYRSVSEIAGTVDLAVVTIPALKVFDLIPQFREKGIQSMLLISSGFGETGSGGKQNERELVQQAREAGIRILGPNTMGICNPHIDFHCTGFPVRPIAGSTAVVAQSGNLGAQLLAFAEEQAIGIRGFAGSGNEAMITIEDYIEGFEEDTLTETVMLYLESVKNGRRFFESSRRLGKKKPIVLLKGGQSDAGKRAASSHTGALASDSRIFDAVCRQAGIVKVNQPMELLHLAAGFSSVPLPTGNRVAIMTFGGGWGVITADLCAQFGLDVPELPDSITEKIDLMLPSYWSRSNPIDIVGEYDTAIPLKVMEELLRWEGCDAVINLGIHGWRIFTTRFLNEVERSDPNFPKERIAELKQMYSEFEKKYTEETAQLMESYGKPIFGVSLLTDEENQTVYPVDGCRYKSVFFQSPEQAVRVCGKMYEYYCFSKS
ncbi:MAG: acetate--CoA ligase family protein [Deltaproteobacteria bacterium]|nr:acetate--CoA ligase family protein [Deltaproteobacteria bacterium]